MGTKIFVSYPFRLREECVESFIAFAKRNGVQYLPDDKDTKGPNILKNRIIIRFKDTAKFNVREDVELYKMVDWHRTFGTVLFIQMKCRDAYDKRLVFFDLDRDGKVRELSGEHEWRSFMMRRVADALEITSWDHMRPDSNSAFLPNDREKSKPVRLGNPVVREALKQFLESMSDKRFFGEEERKHFFRFVKICGEQGYSFHEGILKDHMEANNFPNRMVEEVMGAFSHLLEFYKYVNPDTLK